MRNLALAVLAGAITVGGAVCSATAQEPVPARIKGGILNGKALRLPQPEYPSEAKAAGLEGTVFVDVEIDEFGEVVSAVASTEPRKAYDSRDGAKPVEREMPLADPILREAAERAAMQAKFSPTRLNNKPVRVLGTIAYNFAIRSFPVTPSEGVLNSAAINLPMPMYPPAAMAVRAEGQVVIQILVDESGNVVAATPLSGHPLLRAASVEAARNTKFPPRIENGQAVKFSGVLTYNFVGPAKENGN